MPLQFRCELRVQDTKRVSTMVGRFFRLPLGAGRKNRARCSRVRGSTTCHWVTEGAATARARASGRWSPRRDVGEPRQSGAAPVVSSLLDAREAELQHSAGSAVGGDRELGVRIAREVPRLGRLASVPALASRDEPWRGASRSCSQPASEVSLTAPMRVVAWNVNGIRACVRKGFKQWLTSTRPTIVALQEVRALPEEALDALQLSRSWYTTFASAEKRGYSGVGILSRCRPDEVLGGLEPQFEREGRFVAVRFGRLAVASAYFPKGDGPRRDLSRVPYKLAFYDAARRRLNSLRRRGLRVFCLGDFNTAHRAIDLARPKQNVFNSGFRPEEREALNAWIDDGWVDTYRAYWPDRVEYSWWAQRGDLRARNVGWRIDYALASRAAAPFVRSAFIETDVPGSDHCPVGVQLDPKIVT